MIRRNIYEKREDKDFVTYGWMRIADLEKEITKLMWKGRHAEDIDEIKIEGENVIYMHQGEEIVIRNIQELARCEIDSGPGFNWAGEKYPKSKGLLLAVVPTTEVDSE